MKQLAQLTDEERRVLCAEALGKPKTTRCPECYGTGAIGSESDHEHCFDCNGKGVVAPYYDPFPSPDQSPADALALCDHLKSQGWSWTIFSNPTVFFYETPEGRCVRANEKTVPRAIVSAFLLAKGLAR